MLDMDINVLKALADERRLAIVEMLADGERCICELASGLDASDALVSHHVKKLREAGIVQTRRVGQWLHCSLDVEAFAAISGEVDALSDRAAQAAQGGCCACCAKADPQ
jgi:ArsR family transcriptional regulator